MAQSQQDSKAHYPTIQDFVLQEAFEKAFEVNVLALKDYEKEKSQIVAERKEHLHEEFEKRHKDSLSAARIHKSSLINNSRMKKMQIRHSHLLDIVGKAENHLRHKIVANDDQYRKLVKKLIVEGMIKMLEPVILVRCLERDSSLVESLITEAKNEFKNLVAKEQMPEEVGRVDLRLDRRFFLKERIIEAGGSTGVDKSEENEKCFGGVILTTEDGLIVCKNTLDSRVELAFQQMLPAIRSNLFS